MAALQTIHAVELKGLYANANRLTVPKGSVPRLCNLYLVRRGAFHTVPGSKWVSSFDGLAPHAGGQQPIIYLKWYSPSIGSSPEQYLQSIGAPNVIAHNYLLGLQTQTGPTGVALIDASVGAFLTLATQDGAVSTLSNAVQIGDYLVVALGNTVAPNIFPTVTQTTQQVGNTDTIINVNNTIAFPSQGTIQIDSELIAYSSTTPTSFQGLTRGAYGTAAAIHAAGAMVFLAGAASTGAAPVTTTLTMAMLSSDATADVASTAMFPMASYQMFVDSELIFYDRSATTPTSFVNLFRGANLTTPAAHLLGATVFSVLSASNGASIFTTVVGAISAGSVSVQVSSTNGFPPTGFIYIDTECIQYTGRTATFFTGLMRGQAGTVAAAHNNGASVYGINSEITGVGTEKIWAPIVNNFDPSIIYGGWPGTQNAFNITADQAAVNIGTVIFVKDGTGEAWLFRAQNSGVTGAGNKYVGPQFFPEGLIGTMASTTASSNTLTLPTNTPMAYLFTQEMVGQPITVYGAATSGGDLQANIVSVASNGLSLVMSVAASTTITGPASYPIMASDVGANFVIGVGHFGDSIQDDNEIDQKPKRGEGTGTEVWLNIGPASLAPPGAAFVFQHLNFLFLWGVGNTYGPDGITGPDALWQSDFGQPMVFNAANTTFAGKGDGASAQGGAVYSLSEAGIAATPQLVLFKDAATYSFLNEFPNASLVEVSGGLGCIAPNTIQFIGGYGVMRLSYAGVALFDGQLEHVTEYTDAIRGYLYGGLPDVIPVDFDFIENCVSTQSVNPPLYMFFAPLKREPITSMVPAMFVVGGNGATGVDGTGGIFRTTDFTGATPPADVTPAGFISSAGVNQPGNDYYSDVQLDPAGSGKGIVAGDRIDYSLDFGKTWLPTNITSGTIDMYGPASFHDLYSDSGIKFGTNIVAVACQIRSSGNPAIAWAPLSNLATGWTIIDLSTQALPAGGTLGVGQNYQLTYGNGQFLTCPLLNGSVIFGFADEVNPTVSAVFQDTSIFITGLTFGNGIFAALPYNFSDGHINSITSPTGFLSSWTKTALGVQYVDAPHLPDAQQNPDGGLNFDQASGLWYGFSDGRDLLWTAPAPSGPWTSSGYFEGGVPFNSIDRIGSTYYLLGSLDGNVYKSPNLAAPASDWTIVISSSAGGPRLGTTCGVAGIGMISVGPPTTGNSNNSGFSSTDGGATWSALTGPIAAWLAAQGFAGTARMFDVVTTIPATGVVTRGFGYDFGLKQWFTMDLPFAITSAGFFPQAVRALVAGYQSLVGGASDGAVRRLFKGDPDWDDIPIEWNVRLPDWGFPGTPTYVRRVNPLITADGGGAAAKLLTVFFQGIRRSSQAFGRFLNLPKSLLGSMEVGETVITGNVEIRGQGQVLIEGTDAQTSEKPTARVGL